MSHWDGVPVSIKVLESLSLMHAVPSPVGLLNERGTQLPCDQLQSTSNNSLFRPCTLIKRSGSICHKLRQLARGFFVKAADNLTTTGQFRLTFGEGLEGRSIQKDPYLEPYGQPGN